MAWTPPAHSTYTWQNAPSTATPLDATHLAASEQDSITYTQQVGSLLGIGAVATKLSNYVASAGDFVPVDTTSGAITVTLPTTPADQTRVGVKLINGANTLTVQRGGSDVFNTAGGPTSVTLTLNQAMTFQYQSSTTIWHIQTGETPSSVASASSLVNAYLATITGMPRSVLDPAFGGKGGRVDFVDGAISTGNNQFSSASANFTAASVGWLLTVKGAGASGKPFSATISGFVSATTVNLSANAATTVVGASGSYGHDDTAAFNALFATTPTPECSLTPGSQHVVTSILGVPGMRMHGATGATIKQINPAASSARPLFYFPSGHGPGYYYKVTFDQGLHLLGEGIDIATVFQQCPIGVFDGPQEWRIKDVIADGFAFAGLRFTNGLRIWVDDCTVLNCGQSNWGNGIDLQIQSSAAGAPNTITIGTQALPTATLNVTNATGFPASGSIWAGGQILTYTGTTPSTFTGVTGGTGSLPNGVSVYPVGVTFPEMGEYHVRGVTVEGHQTIAVVVSSGVGYADLEVEIDGAIVRNGFGGIWAEAGWVKKGVISGCVVDNCTSGVEVINTFNSSEDPDTISDWTLSDNEITNDQVPGSFGVSVNGAHIAIEGGHIGASNACIWANNARSLPGLDLSVVGVEMYHFTAGNRASLTKALQIQGYASPSVKSCLQSFGGGGAHIGMYFDSCSNPDVAGNSIDGPGWHGVWYHNCTGVKHAANDIRNINGTNQTDGSGVYLDGTVIDTRHTIDAKAIVDNYSLDAPSNLQVTQSGSGSTLAGVQSYRVSATTAQGETLPSGAVAITITAAQDAVLTWSAPIGQGTVTGYKVYGRTAGAEALITTVGAGTLTYTDDGSTAPSGATAGWNASGNMIYGVNSQLLAGSRIRLLSHDVQGANTADINDLNFSITDLGLEDFTGQANGVYAPYPAHLAGAPVTLVAQRVLVARTWVPNTRKFTKVTFFVNTAGTANDNCIVAVYNKNGTLLSQSASTAGLLNGTATEKTVTLLNPLVIGARNVLYAAFLCPSIGGTAAKLWGANSTAVLFGGLGVGGGAIEADQMAGQATMPATFTFSNSAGALVVLTIQ